MWCLWREKRSSSAQATISPSRRSAAELSPIVVSPRTYMSVRPSSGSTDEAPRVELSEARVDSIRGPLIPAPGHELGEGVLEAALRFEPEHRARPRRVREAVAHVARAIPAQQLRPELDSEGARE